MIYEICCIFAIFLPLFHMLVYFLQLIVVPGVKMEVPALGLGYVVAEMGGKETDVNMVCFIII